MIEPTETESKETLDRFVDDLVDILRQAREAPDALHAAPTRLPITRLDEVRAARAMELTDDAGLAAASEPIHPESA
jgi:glycine dehydrogenase subunit 2